MPVSARRSRWRPGAGKISRAPRRRSRRSAVGLTLPVDLASEDETAEAVERTVEALGRIDVLINAAGTDAPGTVEELDVEGWDRTLAVNRRRPEKGGEGNTTGTRRTSTTGWLADRLGVEIIALTGAHTPYLDHPAEMAEAIRPFLWQVSQPGQSDRVQAVRRKR